MTDTRYSRVIPNSQSFGSLENILVSWEYQPEELTKDYMLIGLRNTIERKYEIRIVANANAEYDSNKPVFINVKEIITYIESNDYYIQKFISIIKNTLNGGLDLKNITKKSMERKKVYKRIDTERDYQDLRWSPRREKNDTPDESKPPAEWLVYMRKHVDLAFDEVYNLDEEKALAHVRKVAALAVRCLEIHGCPKRVIPEELQNQE